MNSTNNLCAAPCIAPAPWSVQPDASSHGECLCICAADGTVIVRTPVCEGGFECEEQRLIDAPNATAIAALPDLIAALRDLLNCTELNLDDMEPHTLELIERARAAIAKAEGAQ